MSSSSFSFPVLPAADIVTIFKERGIASISAADLSAPSSDLVCSLYTTILADLLDPSAVDVDSQIDFGALQSLQNPEIHSESIRKTLLYRSMRSFLHAIKFGDFGFKDITIPDPRRTLLILSCIVNFFLHREEKMNMLQPIVDRLPKLEERKLEIEAKLSELDRESLEYEASREMEQPLTEQLQAEVKELKQTIHSLNKEQMSLKARAMSLKETAETLKDKISQADFELVKNVQENSKLRSRVVQSPDKLQRAIEEKKSLRTAEMNAERSAMLVFKERSAKLEVLTKVCEKLCRQFKKMEVLQEQVNSTKALDKEIKALKARLSDGELLNMSLDAQIVELQGKVTQAENSVKDMEKTKGIKLAEKTKKLESTKEEIARKMQTVKKKELDAEAMVEKGEQNLREIDGVKEDRKILELEMLKKSEELAEEYRKYAARLNPILQGIVSENAFAQEDP